MSKESREDLSCLMDGEISKETSRFLIRRLGADSEFRETWARYHLIRDCLRPQEVDLAGIGLCGRVQQVLANEAPQAAARRFAIDWSKSGVLKAVVGMAVAASVALMAIITVGPGPGTVRTSTGELAGSPKTESFISPNNVLTSTPRSQEVSVLGGTGNSSQRINSYLLRHYQVAESTGGKGFVTFVPIIVTQSATWTKSQDAQRSEADEGGDILDKTKKSVQ